MRNRIFMISAVLGDSFSACKNEITVILFILVFASCSHKKNDDYSINGTFTKVYPVDPKESKIVYLSSIFDSISYQTFQLSDSTVIGSIDKIEIHNFRYYFWDKIGRKIWCYDLDGNFIFKLDKRGQGPGEYLGISDFNIDKERQQLLILDQNSKKILCYDLNGNHIKNFAIDVSAVQFAIVENGWLLYSRGGPDFLRDKIKYGYNLLMYDFDGNLLEQYCPYNDITDRSFGLKNFSTFNQQIFFRYAINDTIYQFDYSGYLKNKILFDFGKYRMPLKSINDFQEMSEYSRRSNYTRVYESFHTSKFMFISYSFEKRLHFLLFDKESENIINGSFLENDIDNISFANPIPIFAWQNQLIYVKEASDIVEQKKEGEKIHKRISQLQDLNEEDNPVIIIAYLKTK